ncbi:AMP-binding protein [Streptomyces sp. A7024]|uniref:AMP-binding protein n=1 Tax=Streptomyces coryli TaxID=1128680 RepID=A0A6G4U1K8_9ACTN|nr:AMP-binding protein [Streptomyces coryli]NGN65882.1 AMP-binding protein [Streptomyces coryli]
MDTVDQLLRAQWNDHRPGLRHDDLELSRHDVAAAAAARAALLAELLPPGAEPHVGVLLGNVPEYPLWLSAAALAGAAVVGINPTRRGEELARDIRHTECAVIVTERELLPLVEGLGIPLLVTDSDAYGERLAPHRTASPVDFPERAPGDRMLLTFTSGSTGAPKAVIVTQGRLARAGQALARQFRLGPEDVHYVCMPLFHGNAVIAGWAPALAGGGAVALRRTFSASGFVPDVRRYGATYFTYVGRAVQYILATPPNDDDRDHRLRMGFGTEAGAVDAARFEERFGVPLIEGYGSSEGGAAIQRTPDTPAGAVGRASPGDDLAVVDPRTGAECPPGVIGELVNRSASARRFEGYWRNETAAAERRRGGWYWSGDLFFRDEDGWLYFAGRADDRLRVDGENLAAAVIEGILARYAPAAAACVYAVPDPVTGDQVMAALALREAFDPEDFRAFLDAQDDLGTKAAPRFVRIMDHLPVTATSKVRRSELRAEAFRCTDEVWWAPEGGPYRRLTGADLDKLLRRYEEHGRAALLG